MKIKLLVAAFIVSCMWLCFTAGCYYGSQSIYSITRDNIGQIRLQEFERGMKAGMDELMIVLTRAQLSGHPVTWEQALEQIKTRNAHTLKLEQ